MDDFGGLLFIAFLYVMFHLLSRPGQQRSRRPPQSRLPSAPPPESGRVDATQQEGSRLERMLRDLERSLDEVARGGERPAPPASERRAPPPPRGSPAPPARRSTPLPAAEEVEERATLETDPLVVSLETGGERPGRIEVGLEEEAETVEQRRIEAAARRDRPLTLADHRAFDEQIRAVPDHTAVAPRDRVRQLRDAVLWTEILGRPKALRE
jgi:hypothetical protein